MVAFKDTLPKRLGKIIRQSMVHPSMYNRTWYADVVSATQFRICTNADLTNYFDTRSINGWGVATETITDATRSNPVILTMTGHGYPNGQSVQGISGVVGMTQLNGNSYYAQ